MNIRLQRGAFSYAPNRQDLAQFEQARAPSAEDFARMQPAEPRSRSRVRTAWAIACAAGVVMVGLSSLASVAGTFDKSLPLPELDPSAKARPDLSGRKRLGKASVYASRFAGRKMADGTAMDPRGNNAASRTLPLGTTARVTNLETGQSAVVVIRDRGPYVVGHIVDLSPATAQKIGITPRRGVAEVSVAPISVPLPNGGVKLGEAARDQRIE